MLLRAGLRAGLLVGLRAGVVTWFRLVCLGLSVRGHAC